MSLSVETPGAEGGIPPQCGGPPSAWDEVWGGFPAGGTEMPDYASCSFCLFLSVSLSSELSVPMELALQALPPQSPASISRIVFLGYLGTCLRIPQISCLLTLPVYSFPAASPCRQYLYFCAITGPGTGKTFLSSDLELSLSAIKEKL